MFTGILVKHAACIFWVELLDDVHEISVDTKFRRQVAVAQSV
jgi:hypothetical protein